MTEQKATNITWHAAEVTRADRQHILGHKSATLWFTGLSASGKSTLARRVEQLLIEQRFFTYVLDGDNVRHGLNKDLGFSHEDRTENIRRISEVAKLFTDAGAITLTAFISPYRADRNQARTLIGDSDFVEVYVKAPIEVCESRDPKGLYKKARAGQIPEFTGISAPYEEPENPELVIRTDESDLETCAQQVVQFLRTKGVLAEKR